MEKEPRNNHELGTNAEGIRNSVVIHIIRWVAVALAVVAAGKWGTESYGKYRDKNLQEQIVRQLKTRNLLHVRAILESAVERMEEIIKDSWRICDLAEKKREIHINKKASTIHSGIFGDDVEIQEDEPDGDIQTITMKQLAGGRISFDESGNHILIETIAEDYRGESSGLSWNPSRRCWGDLLQDMDDSQCEVNINYILLTLKKDKNGNIVGLDIKILYLQKRDEKGDHFASCNVDMSFIDDSLASSLIEKLKDFFDRREAFQKTMGKTQRKCRSGVFDVEKVESALEARRVERSPELIEKLTLGTVRIVVNGRWHLNGTIIAQNEILTARHGFTDSGGFNQDCMSKAEVEITYVEKVTRRGKQRHRKIKANAQVTCESGPDIARLILDDKIFPPENVVNLKRSFSDDPYWITYFLPDSPFYRGMRDVKLSSIEGGEKVGMPYVSRVHCYNDFRAQPGDSGTGVFNPKGEVVGVISCITGSKSCISLL